MTENLKVIEEVRDRMVVGVSIMRHLAALALEAPPELAAELENIAAIGHRCASANLAQLTDLIDSRKLALVAM